MRIDRNGDVEVSDNDEGVDLVVFMNEPLGMCVIVLLGIRVKRVDILLDQPCVRSEVACFEDDTFRIV